VPNLLFAFRSRVSNPTDRAAAAGCLAPINIFAVQRGGRNEKGCAIIGLGTNRRRRPFDLGHIDADARGGGVTGPGLVSGKCS
jgi:hypothetical protein